jgi:hypothetical protein
MRWRNLVCIRIYMMKIQNMSAKTMQAARKLCLRHVPPKRRLTWRHIPRDRTARNCLSEDLPTFHSTLVPSNCTNWNLILSWWNHQKSFLVPESWITSVIVYDRTAVSCSLCLKFSGLWKPWKRREKYLCWNEHVILGSGSWNVRDVINRRMVDIFFLYETQTDYINYNGSRFCDLLA